ncbi:hypothetical protein LX15_004067 [Streptoalloteichus tenebrarius]|uniref:SseB protein N-terminal domain-containing protein n=1 Tax=Streptoalloteichus tenebrarius (strain ATCC 17920 / DSM 40477 / JCM 4838 / CBS 697.72 / NBRC 16177 / NCIMB 11028 / NRRL B-12390 / A12253. 1 / ISP 5477) TaxID=1933 RepID=A0ABT1HXV6_STRSD|nr:hypothetical protein [Streptoalloteichus tenebrarius]MCP2260353.1 hypothetical protein [Streptoalloteichus tenebrarius]BFF02540.1 hypothetical protein GCM10020241_42150 [Streptoalloteichus tenebrarius]
MGELHIFDYLAKPPLPSVDESDIEKASTMSDEWLAYVDPNLPKGAPITGSFLMGGRFVDKEGRITDEYWVNPDFIPQQPKSAGMRFGSHFELVLWRTLKGYNNIDRFLASLSQAELFTPGSQGAPDKLWFENEPDGKRVLPVYSSQQFLPPDRYPWRTISGLEILEKVCPQEGTVIHFNPDGILSVGLSGAELNDLWAEWKKFDAMAKERTQAGQGMSTGQRTSRESR